MIGRIPLLVLALVLSGCSSSVEPDEATPPERVGVIWGLDRNDPAITIPDSARVDETMWVTVVTWWPNGCSEASRTSVEENDDRFLVTPYDLDWEAVADGCEMMGTSHTHTVGLVFAAPGIVRVTIQGRHAPYAEYLTSVHRFVTVVR